MPGPERAAWGAGLPCASRDRQPARPDPDRRSAPRGTPSGCFGRLRDSRPACFQIAPLATPFLLPEHASTLWPRRPRAMQKCAKLAPTGGSDGPSGGGSAGNSRRRLRAQRPLGPTIVRLAEQQRRRSAENWIPDSFAVPDFPPTSERARTESVFEFSGLRLLTKTPVVNRSRESRPGENGFRPKRRTLSQQPCGYNSRKQRQIPAERRGGERVASGGWLTKTNPDLTFSGR